MKLNENKSSDPSSLVSEHVIYADNAQLYKWMSQLYNNIFNEQSTPIVLCKSTIHPLVKSYKKSLQSFGNYRGISIIPVFTKILEYIILLKCPELTNSHHLQHGYKKSSSTLHAEFLIRETIHYYNTNHSPLFICGLDAEKAFDSCNWNILFEKLYHDKQISLAVVNVIKSLYTQGTASVKYKGKYSSKFSLSQDVRQGSVLSPHLYNIYTEDLLTTLENHSIDGTTLYGHYTGISMYADDIILMSATLNGLKNLINTCVSVSKQNCINFNTDKTEFCISNNSDPFLNSFTINGYTIKPSNSLNHHCILWNLKQNILTMDDENINKRLSKFWSIIKALIKEGIRFCHPQTIKQLYITLAVPTLTYGLELCNLSPTLMNRLNIESRKALKHLFNVSIFSKNYISTLLNIESISTRIIRNKFNLLTRLLYNRCSANIIMRMLQSSSENYSFINDLYKLSHQFNINLTRVIITRESPRINNTYNIIEENKYQLLVNCINTWNNPETRKHFTNIMEENVLRV